MTTVVALGEAAGLQGFALVGVRVLTATSGDEMRTAWRSLDRDVGLVILSPMADHELSSELAERPDVLTVVMPS